MKNSSYAQMAFDDEAQFEKSVTSSGKKWSTSYGPACYESHPPLVIGEHVIYGGSCIRPTVKDADVYVGFDAGMTLGPRSYPWTPGEEFLFYIRDMHAPDDPASFSKLITYLSEQLTANKKVHLGCIGGHGRTGTVLAALVRTMTGEKDAITFVREHYCKRAVESTAQIEFLAKHYGIDTTTASKATHSSRAPLKAKSKKKATTGDSGGLPPPRGADHPLATSGSLALAALDRSYRPPLTISHGKNISSTSTLSSSETVYAMKGSHASMWGRNATRETL